MKRLLVPDYNKTRFTQFKLCSLSICKVFPLLSCELSHPSLCYSEIKRKTTYTSLFHTRIDNYDDLYTTIRLIMGSIFSANLRSQWMQKQSVRKIAKIAEEVLFHPKFWNLTKFLILYSTKFEGFELILEKTWSLLSWQFFQR